MQHTCIKHRIIYEPRNAKFAFYNLPMLTAPEYAQCAK